LLAPGTKMVLDGMLVDGVDRWKLSANDEYLAQ
jgi:hypothetical protein